MIRINSNLKEIVSLLSKFTVHNKIDAWSVIYYVLQDIAKCHPTITLDKEISRNTDKLYYKVDEVSNCHIIDHYDINQFVIYLPNGTTVSVEYEIG